MTVNEIIVKIDEALQDASISPTLLEVNNAITFIASQSFLPSLITTSSVKFDSNTRTIAGATNASPIIITTTATHGFNTGDRVTVVDVLGNDAANATWYIEVLGDMTFSLLTSEGDGDYVSGGTVEKRDAFISLPSDFDHDLFEVFSVSQVMKLNIRSNLKAMCALHDADDRATGTKIEDVAVENGRLYCLPTGTTDDVLLLKYYRHPTDMLLTTESPSCIPEHLHESIIVPYILSLKWPLVEDGMEGETVNTSKAISTLTNGIAALMAYYPRPSIASPIIPRNIIWF